MNIEEFRTYCLSFPGACDKMPFDKAASEYDRELLVFCVRDKWFCFVHIREFDFCCLKCDPDEAIDLRDRYEGIEPGYHMNKRHWINVRFDRDVPDSEIRRLGRLPETTEFPTDDRASRGDCRFAGKTFVGRAVKRPKGNRQSFRCG